MPAGRGRTAAGPARASGRWARPMTAEPQARRRDRAAAPSLWRASQADKPNGCRDGDTKVQLEQKDMR
jgi:hypothetical protein